MQWLKKIWTSLILTYHYLKMTPQLIKGAWKISKLPQPVVSVFGGTRLQKDSPYLLLAEELSRRLVSHGISVITGGGPGIMEAANCGAIQHNDHVIYTMGIGVRGLTDTEPVNACVTEYVLTDYFEMRKYLLIYYSYAYVIFPGGFGTMDEFSDVMTLMQAKKIPEAPIIFIGTEYWSNFMNWIERGTIEGLIPPNYVDYVTVTDDLDQAIKILINYCERCNNAFLKKIH